MFNVRRILDRARRTVSGVGRELNTRLYGFDVFISHTRDGMAYAVALEAQLASAAKRCFLDQSELHLGLPLRRKLAWALGRSSLLIVVATEQARSAPWTIAEARYYRRYRPDDPIVPIAFGDPVSAIPWAVINGDLFDAGAADLGLRPGWGGQLARYRAAVRDRARAWLGRGRPADVEEFIGVSDSPSNLASATPGKDVILRVIEAQRRLDVSVRARRGAIAALAFLGVLLTVAGLLTARTLRNLPGEHREKASQALRNLGFRVTDDRETKYEVSWDADPSKQGPLSAAAWAKAAEPLSELDRHADIAKIELIVTRVGDLRPLEGLATVRELGIMGSDADDLTPIVGMTRLEELSLVGFPRLEDDDLNLLRGFGRLGKLNLTSCINLTDRAMEPIARLPLRNLWLTRCPKVDNAGLARLAGMPLEKLLIDHSGARVDGQLIGFLSGLPRLKSLNAKGLPVEPPDRAKLMTLAVERGFQVILLPDPAGTSPHPPSAGGARPSGPGTSSGHAPNPPPHREGASKS